MQEQEPLQNGHVPGKSGKRRKKKQRLPEDGEAEDIEQLQQQQLSPIDEATYEVCTVDCDSLMWYIIYVNQ